MLTLILVIFIIMIVVKEVLNLNHELCDIFEGIFIILSLIDSIVLFFIFIGYMDTRHIDEEIKLYENALQESVETYGVDSYYYKRNYKTLMQLKENKIYSKDYKWLLYFGK